MLAKRVVLPILPSSSVDNHICATINKTFIINITINQPCNDDVILQNSSSEAISPPNAIHNYDNDQMTFHPCNINSASYAAKNYLFNKCVDHHVWSV